MAAFALSLPAWVVPAIAVIVATAAIRPLADVRRAVASMGAERVLADH